MAGRLRRLWDVARCLPRIDRGSFQMQCCRSLKSAAAASSLLHCLLEKSSGISGMKLLNGCSFRRFTAATQIAEVSATDMDLLTFIKSSLDDNEGPSHCWVNKAEGSGDAIKRDGIFLVIAGAFHQDSSPWCHDYAIMIENVKKVQQRYPLLNVMGFQSRMSTNLDAYQASLSQLFMNEYVSFPIIYSRRDFPQVADGQCYFVFKNFSSPIIYLESGADLEVLDKALRDLDIKEDPHSELEGTGQKKNVVKETSYQDVYANEKDQHSGLKANAQKQNVVKEPCVSSLMRNLLLYSPGCISTDDCGNRIFLSDSNHHRIIIIDDMGVIQDCVGSSPGFEDGEFETAKLFRPAASYYDEAKEWLYFVDSENHAIRRANLEKRVIETVYPSSNSNNKTDGLWSWIRNKVGKQENDDTNDEDFNPLSLMFPWHLLKSEDDDFYVMNRSFESLWIMDPSSWEIKEVVRGPSKISEFCGQMTMDKVSPLKQFPCDWLQGKADNASSLGRIPYSGLLSSFATIKDGIIFYDTVRQQLLEYNRETGFTYLQLSNFGILGLPYWLDCTLEKVYSIGDVRQPPEADDIQSFTLLPGEVQMQIIIDIPSGTELVEPIQDGSIWRQARGAAVEISRSDQKEISVEKVGIAQQWYDELDSISLLPESDEEVEEDVGEAKIVSISTIRDDQVCINCAVNTSPGTSEVIIYAALYLRLKKDAESTTEISVEDADRIAAIVKPKKSTNTALDPCFRSILTSNKVSRDLIFMKPLHIRIKLFNLDHPKTADVRETVLTDSFIKVNVSLNS
uniref:NHL domain-containing protein n=1 Tax=Kalanchoe fedtschenkoi TaxID=63787 RepID=A0A7N0TPJ2_KALFE